MPPPLPETMDVALRWIDIAWRVGSLVGQAVLTAIRSGDTSTLDALHGVLPRPEVLAARDEALRQSQRDRAKNQLRAKDAP